MTRRKFCIVCRGRLTPEERARVTLRQAVRRRGGYGGDKRTINRYVNGCRHCSLQEVGLCR